MRMHLETVLAAALDVSCSCYACMMAGCYAAGSADECLQLRVALCLSVYPSIRGCSVDRRVVLFRMSVDRQLRLFTRRHTRTACPPHD